jgi:hypothetical protein
MEEERGWINLLSNDNSDKKCEFVFNNDALKSFDLTLWEI